MLPEIAIADAYASAFEFVDNPTNENDLSQYYSHPKFNKKDEIRTPKSFYTDDTQMSIAIAELIIDNCNWNQFNCAQKFVKVFKRDPRKGYSKRMYSLLNDCKDHYEFMRLIEPNANTNGSIMRSVPLSFLSKDKIISAAFAQASTTHATKNGTICSAFIGLVGYELLNGGKIEDAVKYAYSDLNIKIPLPYCGYVKCNDMITLRAVIYLLLENENKSLKNILYNAVELGGDTDSVASIAVGLASLSKYYINNFENWWYEELEGGNGKYGLDFLKNLDIKLFEKNKNIKENNEIQKI